MNSERDYADTDQGGTSERNESFWDELCGTQLARQLGVVDNSPQSLKAFDDWYFNFYPYLFKHIPFDQVAGRDVLEIGLGYGTVAQRLAERGASYTGLDIAASPVAMVNHRLGGLGLPATAVQGSILAPPFAPESFDTVVSIGCLHHTGNLRLAIDKCWEMLRPGGSFIMMVYYAFSYRRWRMSPLHSLSLAVKEITGYRGVAGATGARHRGAYDIDSDGRPAPHTDWVSKRSVKWLCKRFSRSSICLENIDQEPPFRFFRRSELLNTPVPSLVGLDLYLTATK